MYNTYHPTKPCQKTRFEASFVGIHPLATASAQKRFGTLQGAGGLLKEDEFFLNGKVANRISKFFVFYVYLYIRGLLVLMVTF